MNDGIYGSDVLSHEAYLELDCFSSSGAKVLLRSPAHFKAERTYRKPPSSEFIFGTAVHMGALEPERFEATVLELPPGAPTRPSSTQRNAKKPSDATVAAIAWWAEWAATSAGRIVFDSEELERCRRVVDAIRSHPGAVELLEGNVAGVGRRETSILWTDPDFNVPCKMRADYLRTDNGVVDIKTAADASELAFGRDAAKYLYHVQAAHYLEGAAVMGDSFPPFFAIIAAEKEPPYAVAAYEMPSNAIHAGRRLRNEALGAYKLALASGDWFAYPSTIQPLAFPKWATSFPAPI